MDKQIITLYLTSQHQAYRDVDLYDRIWSYKPYHTDSPCNHGDTLMTRDYVISNKYVIDRDVKGNVQVWYESEVCDLQTDQRGRPHLVSYDHLRDVILHPVRHPC